jgi:hypothetical protein
VTYTDTIPGASSTTAATRSRWRRLSASGPSTRPHATATTATTYSPIQNVRAGPGSASSCPVANWCP